MASVSSIVLGREGTRITDEQLIAAILDGDQKAFAELVEAYSPLLFAIIRPIVGEQHEAEDVLQETFLQVYRSLHQYRQEGFKTWLARIATNKAIDWKRKRLRGENEDLVAETEQLVDYTQLGRNEPEEKFLQRERREKLDKICEGLSPIYQETMDKYYYQEKSYAEIAKEQGVTIKTVESRLYRAKKLLREGWKEGNS